MNAENSAPIKPINIREVFQKKNPKLAKKLPGFVYRYIHRIMHIDEINELLAIHGKEKGIEFANSMVKEFNVHQTLIGVENIPS